MWKPSGSDTTDGAVATPPSSTQCLFPRQCPHLKPPRSESALFSSSVLLWPAGGTMPFLPILTSAQGADSSLVLQRAFLTLPVGTSVLTWALALYLSLWFAHWYLSNNYSSEAMVSLPPFGSWEQAKAEAAFQSSQWPSQPFIRLSLKFIRLTLFQGPPTVILNPLPHPQCILLLFFYCKS